VIRAVLSIGAALALFACGGRIAPDASERESPRPGEWEPGGPLPPPGPSPPPSPGPPSSIQACATTDAPPYGNASDHGGGLQLRGDAQGNTHLYFRATHLRHYVLASRSPCVLEADATFSVDAFGPWRVLSDGAIWSAHRRTLRRVHPEPMKDECTHAGLTQDDLLVAIEQSDSGGALAIFERMGRGDPAYLASEITVDGATCSLGALAPTDGPAARDAARDGLGRRHVRTADGIRIFDPQGTLVSTYFEPGPPHDYVAGDLASCRGGICILGSSADVFGLLYVDHDGKLRAAHGPRVDDLSHERIAVGPSGRVFLLGWTDPSTTPVTTAIIQIAPSPPP
jgi:hypothetical protein